MLMIWFKFEMIDHNMKLSVMFQVYSILAVTPWCYVAYRTSVIHVDGKYGESKIIMDIIIFPSVLIPAWQTN